jgi:hypothetical protein
MKVFISWSGSLSKDLAEILRLWLPAVIQAVKPYYSPDDITKGARWSNEIGKELEECRVGLICLTRDNLEAPWIMFEAGALSKKIDESRVCPILFGIGPTDVQGPLIQFQLAQFEKSEIRRVVKMINTALGESSLDDSVLDSVFEMWWPRLKEKVEAALLAAPRTDPSALRSERDLLEEILKLSRSTAVKSRHVGSINPAAVKDLVDGFSNLVTECKSSGRFDELKDSLNSLVKPIRYIVRRTVLGADDMKGLETAFESAKLELEDSLFEIPMETAPKDSVEEIDF